jgi:mRNA interferase MazF
MIREGQIVLFKFPLADKSDAKLRPALVLKKLPGHHNDWLICMISSQLSQRVADFDEVVDQEATDWERSGLKITSVVRIARLAVVHESILVGAIGEVAPSRLGRIMQKLSDWLLNR